MNSNAAKIIAAKLIVMTSIMRYDFTSNLRSRMRLTIQT